jgi:hypothetical protein
MLDKDDFINALFTKKRQVLLCSHCGRFYKSGIGNRASYYAKKHSQKSGHKLFEEAYVVTEPDVLAAFRKIEATDKLRKAINNCRLLPKSEVLIYE